MAAMASDILSGEKKKKCVACFEKVLMIAETVPNCVHYHYTINKKHWRTRRMVLVSEARASVKALQSRNNLHYLFQETIQWCACAWKTNRRIQPQRKRQKENIIYLVFNSVLFEFDPADHFGKFGSKLEEVDCESYYRHRFPAVIHLEDNVVRSGMATRQVWEGDTLLI